MEQIIINQNENQEITINSNIPQLLTISNNQPQNININVNKNQDLKINQLENQSILIDNGNTIIITDILVNGVSVVSNGIAYIIVPTKTSELTNDSGFITNESDPTVPSYVKAISLADINNWNNKQNELVSGSTIKTINNTSLLGSGNIEITGTEYIAGNGININNNTINNTITSYDDLEDLPNIPEKVSDLINDENFVSSNDLSNVAFSGSYADLSNTPNIPQFTSELTNDSGFIDKNVNDLTYYTPTANLGAVALSNDYTDLTNKPIIPTVNDGTLTIQQNGTNIETFTANSSTNKTANITIPTKTSDLTNDSGFITNNYEIYSSTETRIGTWINNEAIYRKVINFGNLPNATTKSMSTGLTNVTYINIYGYATDGTYYWPLNTPRPIPGNSYGIGCYINNNQITIECGTNKSSNSAYVVIEYIKN